MELTYATETRFGFLDVDDNALALDPLQPGQAAFFVTSPDFEGITLIGTPEQLSHLANQMAGFLDAAVVLGSDKVASGVRD